MFVTGGSGFVGGAVIRSLTKDYTVRAMARSEASAGTVARLGATPVMCSLEDVGPEQVEGCQTVIHCAAETKEWAPPGLYESTNTRGTVRLLDAARSAGVGRFVHISTDSVLCTGGPLHAVDESFPVPSKSPFDYATSKAAGERAVIAANDPPDFETVSIRPSLVWGQGDTTIVPEIKAMVEKGQFLWIGGGHHRISTTNIGNLTSGIRLAMGHSGAGEVFYITDDEPMEMRSFFIRYMGANGTELPRALRSGAPCRIRGVGHRESVEGLPTAEPAADDSFRGRASVEGALHRNGQSFALVGLPPNRDDRRRDERNQAGNGGLDQTQTVTMTATIEKAMIALIPLINQYEPPFCS